MLAELAGLHQQRWTGKGHSGAFASPRFQQFHEGLISRCHSANQVHLIRVRAGDETIGVLYNFLADGRAYFYQGGFRIASNPKMRPGMVTFQVAMQWYLESGLPEFELMAGDYRYKRSIGNGSRGLDWCTIRRPSWRNALVAALRRIRALLQRSDPAASLPSEENQ